MLQQPSQPVSMASSSSGKATMPASISPMFKRIFLASSECGVTLRSHLRQIWATEVC